MDRIGRIHAEQSGARLGGTEYITETTQLAAYQTDIEIDTSAGTAITITLPPAAECRGKIFTMFVHSYSGAITIAAGASEDFTAPTFNGDSDGACWYCDGRRWWELQART